MAAGGRGVGVAGASVATADDDELESAPAMSVRLSGVQSGS